MMIPLVNALHIQYTEPYVSKFTSAPEAQNMNREIIILYISPLLFASILLGLLAYFIWCHRTVQGAVPLMILSLSAAEWSLAYALELVTAQSPLAIVLAKLQYFGITTLPVAWLIFALLYS